MITNKKLAAVLLVCLFGAPALAKIPADFPKFIVPGHARQMQSLRQLFYLHDKSAGPMITLWDEWMSRSTLWPAMGGAAMEQRWAAALDGRQIDAEGYVASQQHDGAAHAEGWPFPAWYQGKGMGWHFAPIHVPGYEPPLTKNITVIYLGASDSSPSPGTPNPKSKTRNPKQTENPKSKIENSDSFHPDPPPEYQGRGTNASSKAKVKDQWILSGARSRGIDAKGWEINLTGADATIEAPPMSVTPFNAPFVRLNWYAQGMQGAKPYLEWATAAKPDFSKGRRVYFDPAGTSESRTMMEMYRLPEWAGTITRLRICFANKPGAKITIKSLHTAYDSRQNVNNTRYVSGCCNYINWTDDIAFVRRNIGKMRRAMRFMETEFQTRKYKCVYTTWVGHGGRSGIVVKNGVKTIIPGRGIGSDYWDLLPFGHEDALATIYYYHALLQMAELEQQIKAHPQWHVPAKNAMDPTDLRSLAKQIKDYAGQRFWSKKTGRFTSGVDIDGVSHDYGFTFLNLDAIAFDFATPQQAQSIMQWIAGKRIVAGDTSTGADIYHWRFGPRATTRRNVDWYLWCWGAPESIPWGGQVQDGGAVMGFAYYDLMSRIKVLGPDSAWKRLAQTIAWFDDVQAAGGYLAYYKVPGRGTLQGGNVPGGLGIIKEFPESVLLPQVMLYGFLGMHPTMNGFAINPKLPSDWPSLEITRIRLHGLVLDITAKRDSIRVTWDKPPANALPLRIDLPSAKWTGRYINPDGKVIGATGKEIDVHRAAGVEFMLGR